MTAVRFLEYMPKMALQLTKRCPADAHRIRAEFDKNQRKITRRHILNETPRRELLPDLEIHHIVPLEFEGSTHEWDNLALVDHETHVEIHRYIAKQTLGMAVGEKRSVRLPTMGGIIWVRPELLRRQSAPLLEQLSTMQEGKGCSRGRGISTARQWARLAEFRRG